MGNDREDNPVSRIFDYLGALLINQIVAPIALLTLFVTLAGLVFAAFGKKEFFGESGKLMIGVFVPLFIVLCLVFKRFGNAVFIIWVFILYVIFILIPLVAIVYVCLKPAYEYLS